MMLRTTRTLRDIGKGHVGMMIDIAAHLGVISPNSAKNYGSLGIVQMLGARGH